MPLLYMLDAGVIPCGCLCRSDYARCRIELSAARLTVLAAAHALDKHGNKKARGQIAAAKVYAPNVVLRVIDAAIQVQDATLLLVQSAMWHALVWIRKYGSELPPLWMVLPSCLLVNPLVLAQALQSDCSGQSSTSNSVSNLL